ncbi:mRNA cap guanine-N7 methyltransferase isoform X1 [Fopius arisanus]|uniref:mRNA cap guanine-N(7) methyltransferase n=1 Tax=Fopius arisanus TaxID=64838 RepID=A0A9R1SVL8_9HYME|nr:PREDICTED: mRNA cap guanine-N7 methyltransferase isoform X1 [Fopius arisanus]
MQAVVKEQLKHSLSDNDEAVNSGAKLKAPTSQQNEDETTVETADIAESSESRKRKHDGDGDERESQKPMLAKSNPTGETSTSGIPSDLSTGSGRDIVEPENQATDHTKVVTQHYNALEEKGLSQRAQSRIIFMRNFNNWIKSMLINEFLEKLRQSSSQGSALKVLDMCCGKGGDLLKWKKANIAHLICADIADVSIEQCETRYKDIENRSKNDRGFAPLFSSEFLVADCTKVRLREKYRDPSVLLDLVSCQFALHYSFETLPQAECMMQNAAETLRAGGYFIASIPDAYDLVSRWKKIDGNKFGNDIFNVEFLIEKENIPLFGAKYNFHLEGVVDCPEFLVYLPLLKKLARKYGLEMVMFERFDAFYNRMKDEGRSLLGNMQALETYPPYHEAPLLGQGPADYLHAIQYMQNSTGHRKIGTLSHSEWDATSLYAVVAFQKMRTTWNSEGKPEYCKL